LLQICFPVYWRSCSAARRLANSCAKGQQVQTAEKLRIPWNRYRWIAAPEAAACVGLLVGYASAPIAAAASIGVVFLMAGALAFRVRIHDSPGFLLGDATLLGLAAATAVLRIIAS
jgi:hypothetical protein